jgi:hypothetical protein
LGNGSVWAVENIREFSVHSVGYVRIEETAAIQSRDIGACGNFSPHFPIENPKLRLQQVIPVKISVDCFSVVDLKVVVWTECGPDQAIGPGLGDSDPGRWSAGQPAKGPV